MPQILCQAQFQTPVLSVHNDAANSACRDPLAHLSRVGQRVLTVESHIGPAICDEHDEWMHWLEFHHSDEGFQC